MPRGWQLRHIALHAIVCLILILTCKHLQPLFQTIVMVPGTEANLSVYAAWVATGARDRGLMLLDGIPGGAEGATRMQVGGVYSGVASGVYSGVAKCRWGECTVV
jgi:hypothetical protein